MRKYIFINFMKITIIEIKTIKNMSKNIITYNDYNTFL